MHFKVIAGAFRNLVVALRRTPLHPQWFAFYREDRNLQATCITLTGIVLDIGCANAKPKAHLPSDAHYVGLDYYSTATTWYGTRPDLFADAQILPLGDSSIDHCLLLDVLEHIPDPDRCLAEVNRALIQGGSLTIQVPFIHDAPLDFCRWTRHGLERAAKIHGFTIVAETAIGQPVESAALSMNIALSKTVLNWIARRNPLGLLIVLLPLLVTMTNCLAWIVGYLSPADDFMPHSYRMVWVKD